MLQYLSKNRILSFLEDKDSTQYLQNIIKDKNIPKETITKIVDRLSGTYLYIIKDKNGNYLLRDLIKNCEQSDRIKILKELYKTISDDCTNKYATYPIQEIIMQSQTEEEFNLILYSFKDYNKTFVASLDPNSSFVIQKIISHIPDKYKKNFNLMFVSFICFIVTKKYGVINGKFFVKYLKDEKIIDKLIETILINFIKIAIDEFGKYFIQYILEIWNNQKHGEKIKNYVKENFKDLYYNKKTVYICRKFLKLQDKNEKINLINSLQLKENDLSIKIEIMKTFEYNYRQNNNNINNNSKNDNLNNTNQNQNLFPITLNQYNNNYLNQYPLSVNDNDN